MKKIILLLVILPLFILVLISGFNLANAQSQNTSNTLGVQASASGNTGVLISWTKSTTAQNYQISRDSTVLATVTSTPYPDKTVADGSHQYTVVALDNAKKTLSTSTVNISKTGSKVTTTAPDATSTIAPPKASDINLPIRDSSVSALASRIIAWIFGAVSSLAVIAIVYSGLMYITSGADTTKAEGAKKNLTWAIIGLVLAISAYFIINIVITRLNTI